MAKIKNVPANELTIPEHFMYPIVVLCSKMLVVFVQSWYVCNMWI